MADYEPGENVKILLVGWIVALFMAGLIGLAALGVIVYANSL